MLTLTVVMMADLREVLGEVVVADLATRVEVLKEGARAP